MWWSWWVGVGEALCGAADILSGALIRFWDLEMMCGGVGYTSVLPYVCDDILAYIDNLHSICVMLFSQRAPGMRSLLM